MHPCEFISIPPAIIKSKMRKWMKKRTKIKQTLVKPGLSKLFIDFFLWCIMHRLESESELRSVCYVENWKKKEGNSDCLRTTRIESQKLSNGKLNKNETKKKNSLKKLQEKAKKKKKKSKSSFVESCTCSVESTTWLGLNFMINSHRQTELKALFPVNIREKFL